MEYINVLEAITTGVLCLWIAYLHHTNSVLLHRTDWLKDKLEETVLYIGKVHKGAELNTETLKLHQSLFENISKWRKRQQAINDITDKTVKGILEQISGNKDV